MNRAPTHLTADQVNQKLVDQYTEIAQLAGGLAHEIKNPLSTIGLNIELLAEDLAGMSRRAGAGLAKDRRRADGECQRLQDLLNDFLTFARVRKPSRNPRT